jgi:transcription antitermination factor NusB
MTLDLNELLPMSKTKKTKGSRHLARVKVLQVLVAYDVCQTELSLVYSHIMNRDFNLIDDDEQAAEPVQKTNRIMRPEEVFELDADVPIEWKEDELTFAYSLLNEVLNRQKYLDELLSSLAENWDLSRIDKIDKYLMQMAAVELMYFPEIPPKVSINEAIDIAKDYSSDKSSVFINGVLDAMLNKLKEENKLNKVGRGLIDK